MTHDLNHYDPLWIISSVLNWGYMVELKPSEGIGRSPWGKTCTRFTWTPGIRCILSCPQVVNWWYQSLFVACDEVILLLFALSRSASLKGADFWMLGLSAWPLTQCSILESFSRDVQEEKGAVTVEVHYFLALSRLISETIRWREIR